MCIESIAKSVGTMKRPGIIIELFCGSCAAARAAKARYPGARVICVDVRDKATIEKVFAKYGTPELLASVGVQFVQMDLRLVQARDVREWCALVGGAPEEIVALHASFPCDMVTAAAAINRTGDRDDQGRAISVAAQWDDKGKARGLELIRWVVGVAPKALITIENPWGASFKKQEMIQELIRDPELQFWMLREDLCATVHGKYDRVITKNGLKLQKFPMKPTCVIVRNINIERYKPRRCLGKLCRMVHPGTTLHKRIIMEVNKETKQARKERGVRQKVVPSHENSVLPMGLFVKLWIQHELWQREQPAGTVIEEDYCTVCANINSGGEVIACTAFGCGRVQHKGCSRDSRLVEEQWKCDTCFLAEHRMCQPRSTVNMEKVSEIIRWWEAGYLKIEQFDKLMHEHINAQRIDSIEEEGLSNLSPISPQNELP